MTVKRMLEPEDKPTQAVCTGQCGKVAAQYLDLLETWRNGLIQELRGLERLLISNGRLQRETLPRKIR